MDRHIFRSFISDIIPIGAFFIVKSVNVFDNIGRETYNGGICRWIREVRKSMVDKIVNSLRRRDVMNLELLTVIFSKSICNIFIRSGDTIGSF